MVSMLNESNDPGSKIPIKSVQYINADIRLVKSHVGGLDVDLSGNQVGALAALCLFEEADRLIGRQHLFKRSLLLAKVGWVALS